MHSRGNIIRRLQRLLSCMTHAGQYQQIQQRRRCIVIPATAEVSVRRPGETSPRRSGSSLTTTSWDAPGIAEKSPRGWPRREKRAQRAPPFFVVGSPVETWTFVGLRLRLGLRSAARGCRSLNLVILQYGKCCCSCGAPKKTEENVLLLLAESIPPHDTSWCTS